MSNGDHDPAVTLTKYKCLSVKPILDVHVGVVNNKVIAMFVPDTLNYYLLAHVQTRFV